MRIVLMGQAAFGGRVFEALLAAGEEVVAVYAPPDISPGKTNTLVALAVSNGTPIRQPARVRALDVIEEYKRFKADLNIMASMTDFVPAAMLRSPTHGTIQYHPSLLPRHRGASPVNWAIINGEKRTGLSIFWPDEGLDTGPILLQEEVAIDPDDTMGDVYYGKLFSLGVKAILEAVDQVKQGTAPKIKQDLSKGEYEPVCRSMTIDWSYPAPVVYNIIRGCNPIPGAATTYKGHGLRVFDCERSPVNGRQAPGTIIQITRRGLVVGASGGSLLVKRVQTKDSGKLDVEEFTGRYGVRVGDRLG